MSLYHANNYFVSYYKGKILIKELLYVIGGKKKVTITGLFKTKATLVL